MSLQLVSRMAMISCFLAVQGCGTTPQFIPGAPNYQKLRDAQLGIFQPSGTGTARAPASLTPQEKSELQAALEKDYNGMLDLCKGVLNNYETQATDLKWVSFWIAIVGAIAGTIVGPALIASAPVANKAASTTMSGLSGLSNTAQAALVQQGLTPGQVLEIRDGIARAVTEATTNYTMALRNTNIDERLRGMEVAVAQGRTACIAYSVAKAQGRP